MPTPDLARFIDLTNLRPEATRADIARLCDEASQLGVFAVCVNPSYVRYARKLLSEEFGSNVKVATVAGFPTGAHTGAVKVRETQIAFTDGAHEIDMVLNVGALKSEEFTAVEAEIRAVRHACGDALLKVILETAVLTDAEISVACQIAESAGAHFVKTSTGMHAAGGATVHAIELMQSVIGGRLGIKASGGVSTRDAALAMIAAGATRIGTSNAAGILATP